MLSSPQQASKRPPNAAGTVAPVVKRAPDATGTAAPGSKREPGQRPAAAAPSTGRPPARSATRQAARPPAADRRRRPPAKPVSAMTELTDILVAALASFVAVWLGYRFGDQNLNLTLAWPVDALALAWILQRSRVGLIGIAAGTLAALHVVRGDLELAWPIALSAVVAPAVTASLIRAIQWRWKRTAALDQIIVMSAAIIVCLAPLDVVLCITAFRNNPLAALDPLDFTMGLGFAMMTSNLIFTPAFAALIKPRRSDAPFGHDFAVSHRRYLPPMLVLCCAGISATGMMFDGRMGGYASLAVWLGLPLLAIVASTSTPRIANLALMASASMILWKHAPLIAAAGHDFNVRLILFQALLTIGSGALAFHVLLALSIDRRRQEAVLAKVATEDSVTGLSNERGLFNKLDTWLAGADRQDLILAELTIAEFHSYVDLIGAQASRFLLRTVADRVRRCAGADPLCVARPSTRRFVIACPASAPVEQFAHQLTTAVDRLPIKLNDRSLMLRVTVGVVRVASDADASRETLLAALSVASQCASTSANRRFVTSFESASVANHRNQLMQIEEVKDAIAARRFKLMAQPIVPVDDPHMTQTKRLHYEVLARMIDRDGQPLPPAKFLPAIAQGSLTREFDRMIIAMTLRKIADDPALRRITESCSINVTGPSLCDPDLAAYFEQELLATGVAPRSIAVELTESESIVDFEAANDNIKRLSDMGITIVIDDFGTGLATFDWVKRIAAQCLKIDGSFVRNIMTSPLDREVVASVVRVARVIGARTVAEQVESLEIADELRAIGVDQLQGFAICKPIALELLGRRMFEVGGKSNTAPPANAGEPAKPNQPNSAEMAPQAPQVRPARSAAAAAPTHVTASPPEAGAAPQPNAAPRRRSPVPAGS